MGLQRLRTEAAELAPAHSELIDSLMGSVNRSDKLIKDLKQFSGPIMPNTRAIYPNDIIASQITLYEEIISERGISIDYLPEFLGTVMADPDLLSIAFENLLKNAIEAQPHGGYIKIHLERESDTAVIVMENAGLELEDKPLHKMLAPYFTTKTHGSGLGLAMVDRIVRAHGGELELDSPRQGEIKIRLILPIDGQT
jgi:signal transduction histidine kinase